MAPVNLVDVTTEEFKQFLGSFDHVFSDCDGVLWLSTGALPGVGDFFKLMKDHGKTVHFVSNNSIRSKENYTSWFDRAGIPGGYENLTVPSVAIAEYLKSVNFDKYVYCVTCSEAKKLIESYGFKTKYGIRKDVFEALLEQVQEGFRFQRPDVGHDDFSNFKEYLIDDPDIGAVVFDSDYKVNMPKLFKASTYLRRPEVLYLDGPTDKFVPFAGTMAIGAAHFSEIVSEITSRKPIGLGKPSKDFGEFAMRRAGVTDPSRVLFIGDMIDQDVGLGKNTGFKTLLVLTHITEEEMRGHHIQPDFYAPSLGSIVPKFKEQ